MPINSLLAATRSPWCIPAVCAPPPCTSLHCGSYFAGVGSLYWSQFASQLSIGTQSINVFGFCMFPAYSIDIFQTAMLSSRLLGIRRALLLSALQQKAKNAI